MDDAQQTSPSATVQKRMSKLIYAGDTGDEPEEWRCCARIPQKVALGIYRQNLHGGVAQHLQSHFPVAIAYLGTPAYRLICTEYLKLSPPEQPVFTIYAAHFPGFLLEYGERNPAQGIWPVAAHLAQIDFFHHNTYQEDQRIDVGDRHYQLWLNIRTIVQTMDTNRDHGLHRRIDLHPEKFLHKGENIILTTFWDNEELFFRQENPLD